MSNHQPPAAPHLTRVLLSVLGALQSSTNPAEPITAIKRMERQTAKAFEDVPAEALGSELLGLLGHVVRHPEELQTSNIDLIRRRKEDARQDRRYSLLLRLAADADLVAPHLALYIWHDYPRGERALNISRVLPHLVAAEQSVGETRAREALGALEDVAELLYKPFLRELVRLDVAMKGDASSPADRLGVLVKQAASRLSAYPGLVDSDAGWLRNAQAHKHFDYDDETDELTLWDDKMPRTKFAVQDLLGRVHRMWELSGPTFDAVCDVLTLRLADKLQLGELALEAMEAFARLDIDAMLATQTKLQERAENEFASMALYLTQLKA